MITTNLNDNAELRTINGLLHFLEKNLSAGVSQNNKRDKGPAVHETGRRRDLDRVPGERGTTFNFNIPKQHPGIYYDAIIKFDQ